MNFDPENKVFQLCVQGMGMEGEGNMQNASELFLRAWEVAITNLEKFTAAHYVARHQTTTRDKIEWDEIALRFALKTRDDSMRAYYPSLYLNIAKGYEDLKEFDTAYGHYQKAALYLDFLPNDGYGKMIKSGVLKGIERISLTL